MDATSPVPPPELRVAVLFDGHNWYHSVREFLQSERAKIEYPDLVNWLVTKLRETLGLPEGAPVHTETWYTTAVPEESASFRENVLGFLLAIERQGVHVERLQTRRSLVTYTFTCPECSERVTAKEIHYECTACGKSVVGRAIRYEEEQVDVAIAVRLVQLSMRREIDVAVLVSRDSDFVPAVVAAIEEGVSVFIASLPSVGGTPPELVRAATGHIDMAEGLRLSMHPIIGSENGG